MLIAGAVLTLLLFAVIVIFAFPRFSPIPYFPSNKKDMALILKALRIRKGQTIIDLGAGDGVVIFEAARKAYEMKSDTSFYAIEINPVLLLVLHIRRLFHPNRRNIRILRRDMFSMRYAPLLDRPETTFYIYISPWFIEKTLSNIKSQLKRFEVVSYFYQVKCLPEHDEALKEGFHKVYSYSL